MTRAEAYWILEEIRKESFSADYVEALGIAQETIEFVDLMPNDMARVVHSKWKYYHKQGKAVCMNCSFERGLDDNFGRAVACPNCGARMKDGE